MAGISSIPIARTLLHGGGNAVDIGLGLGFGFLGVSQYTLDVTSDGKLGGSDTIGNITLAAGLGAGALLAARRLPVMWAQNPRMARVVTTGAVAGVGLLGTAPLALADVDPSAPNRQSKVKGNPTDIPKAVRSSDGIAAPATKPDIIDMTDKVGASGNRPWSSERRGDYAGQKPNFILLHGTGGGTVEGETEDQHATSMLDGFTNPKRPVTSHYVVDRDGKIAMYVDPTRRAWHAGGDGRDWNSASVGIELVNDNTGKDPYTDAQLEAVRQLVQSLSHEFEIPATHVYMHREVQDDRRDPVGFAFNEFLNVLDDTDPIAGRVPNLANSDQPNEQHQGIDHENDPGTALPVPRGGDAPAPAPTTPAPPASGTPSPGPTASQPPATKAPTTDAPTPAPTSTDGGGGGILHEITSVITGGGNDPAPTEHAPTPKPAPTTPAVQRGPSAPLAPGQPMATTKPKPAATSAPKPAATSKPAGTPASKHAATPTTTPKHAAAQAQPSEHHGFIASLFDLGGDAPAPAASSTPEPEAAPAAQSGSSGSNGNIFSWFVGAFG